MIKVEIQKKTAAPLVRAYIDEVKLTFKGDAANKSVSDGEHVLQWFVQGQAGMEYTISITQPASAAFSHTDKLDADTPRDAGHKWFKVGGQG